MSDYQIDWDKHNNRKPDEIRTDIMTTCFHCGVDNKKTARILFAAGFTVKAEVVAKFFAGRQRWLDSKKEAEKAAAAAA